ncbi:MAG: c-type cytochrome [Chitinophagaceae bacterium]|nr:c-type cytochrome [Chitinophagaceae bacterium]
MRKFFVLAVILVTCMTAIYFSSCNNETKETGPAENKDSLSKAAARGEYLAHHVTMCMDCHSKRDITKFAMPVIPGTEGGGGITFGKAEGIPGEVTPPNITPFALKDWTDDEIARALTEGVNKKGDTLFPMMPYHHYSKMTRDDVYSIIAYLRTLKPIDNTTPPRKLLIPPSMFGPLPENTLASNTMPSPSDKIKYGEYLVNAAVCSECHTPMGPQGPDFSKLFAGGFLFDLGFLKVTVANITPDSATGIGTWSEDAFVNKFKVNASPEKVNADPGKENSIMPWSMYGTMKEEDLRAIYAYLRTVKPITNKVEKYPK